MNVVILIYSISCLLYKRYATKKYKDGLTPELT